MTANTKMMTANTKMMTANTKMMTVKEQNKALSQTSVSSSTDLNHKCSIGELNLFLFFFVRWEKY